MCWGGGVGMGWFLELFYFTGSFGVFYSRRTGKCFGIGFILCWLRLFLGV